MSRPVLDPGRLPEVTAALAGRAGEHEGDRVFPVARIGAALAKLIGTRPRWGLWGRRSRWSATTA